MSGERRDDGLWQAVATLPTIAVDEAHAARVQARCRRALERHRRPGRNRTNVAGRPTVADRGRAVTVAMLWTSNAWHTLIRMVGRQQQPG